MLKQIMALLFVLSAAGCSPVLQMTREECREQKEIIGSVRIIRAEMRALAAAYRPIRQIENGNPVLRKGRGFLFLN
ncbi:MAG: hypothetical protein ACLSWJ_06680 [Alphaproteobacteria bacterium]